MDTLDASGFPIQNQASKTPGVDSREANVIACQAAGESSSLPEQQSQDAMSDEVLRRNVIVQDPVGFHLRPLTAFAKRAGQFQSTVTVSKGDERVNGKSPLELMLLAAEQGTELTLEVCGADAAAAIDVLAELLAAPGSQEGDEMTG
jgi:phosphotransferase system HPr (HPr) family protein